MIQSVSRSISFHNKMDEKVIKICNRLKVNRSWLVQEALNYYFDRMPAQIVKTSRDNDQASAARKVL